MSLNTYQITKTLLSFIRILGAVYDFILFCYIIFPDGHIEYAIPSHQEKLISILCNTEHKSRQQVIDETPPEYYFDWLNYLLNKTGCISVWFDFIITTNRMTDAQNDTIINLIQSGAVRLDKNKNEPSIYLKYRKYGRK